MMTLLVMSLAAALFLGMLLFHEVGRHFGKVAFKRDPDGSAKGISAVEGAVFALLGLVVAFTFSGAGSRFEARRALITEEANNIGTAYLRVDLLAASAQPALRGHFRRYVQLRASPPNFANPGSAAMWNTQTMALQQTIWTQALRASQQPDSAPQATMLLVPALNAMIDITTTRYMATRNHPPVAVFILLGGLSLAASLLVGYAVAGNKTRSWLPPMAFAAVVSLSIYLILELEFPRIGLVQVGGADQVLVELVKSMD